MKIGILDHMGNGNLGDAATQEAVIQNLESRCPSLTIVGFSANPHDTQERHKVISYAIHRSCQYPPPQPVGMCEPRIRSAANVRIKMLVSRHPHLYRLLSIINYLIIRIPRSVVREVPRELAFLIESFRAIGSLDVLIISGGGQLNEEWGGPWSFPCTLFKWVILAKLSRVKVLFLNVGAGTLEHPLSKFFIRQALLLSDYCSFRDERTRTLVRQLGFDGRSHVFPDNAYSLDISHVEQPNTSRAGKPIVGIAPMPYCDPRVYPIRNHQLYTYLINQLALFASWLSRNGYTVMLFGSDIYHDGLAIEDLKTVLENEGVSDRAGQVVTPPPIKTTDELLAKISLMDYVVTCRFHGVIFAHLLNKPVLAIAHHPKVSALMESLELSTHCIKIDLLSVEVLIDMFQAIVHDREQIKRSMAERLRSHKGDLKEQFDQLFLQH